MGIETERKFLVNKKRWEDFPKGKGDFLRQGYLHDDKSKVIRIRQTADKGYICIKGPNYGISRLEYEYLIPQKDAAELLDHFCSEEVSKIRYTIHFAGKLWEVDEFLGENEGLIVAEIELADPYGAFELPGWIDREVTGQKKYFNNRLAVHPFKKW